MWKTEKRKLGELKPFDRNPREIGGKQYEELKKSMDQFGTAEPVVVNTDSTIIGGHARWSAAKELGWELIDCWVPNRTLAKREFEALNLRLNKNIAGVWDYEALESFGENLLEEVGFSDQELDTIFEEKDDDDFDAEKEYAVTIQPQTERGQVIRLGDHVLMCGDATNPDDVAKLMGEDKANLVFTDPPYNVNYSGRGKNTSTTIEGDNQSEGDFRQFLIDTFTNYKKIMVGGGAALHLLRQPDPPRVRGRAERGGLRGPEPDHLGQEGGLHGLGRLPLETRADPLCGPERAEHAVLR